MKLLLYLIITLHRQIHFTDSDRPIVKRDASSKILGILCSPECDLRKYVFHVNNKGISEKNIL